MKKLIVVAVLCSVLAGPAWADVKVTSTTSGKGMGMSGEGQSVVYVKGNKMRTETIVKDNTIVSIIDLDAQKMISLNIKKKEAELYDLATLREEMDKTVGAAEVQVSFKANGQKKTIMGHACSGYDVAISIPAGGEGMQMTMTLGGPAWIAKGVPGFEDYAAFFKAAAAKGMFFTSPQQAKAQGAQAKGLAEMYKAMADAGMALQQDISIKMEGSGPMAGLMAKMGNMSMTSTVTDISADALSDDLFTIPAGFKTKNK